MNEPSVLRRSERAVEAGRGGDLESPFRNLIYVEEFRRGHAEASIFEAPPFKMHYASRRPTIAYWRQRRRARGYIRDVLAFSGREREEAHGGRMKRSKLEKEGMF